MIYYQYMSVLAHRGQSHPITCVEFVVFGNLNGWCKVCNQEISRAACI